MYTEQLMTRSVLHLGLIVTVDASYLMTIISLLCASERLPVMLAKRRELSLNKNFPSQSDDVQPL